MSGLKIVFIDGTVEWFDPVPELPTVNPLDGVYRFYVGPHLWEFSSEMVKSMEQYEVTP